MKPLRSALLTALFYCGAALAQPSGDDFDPANPPANFWATHFFFVDMPALDGNGNFQVQRVKAFHAVSALIDGHCKDCGGTKRKHLHHDQDYAVIADANRFWDFMFDAPRTTSRKADATNKTNCYTYALANYVGGGTYNYWLQSSDGDTDAAINVDTQFFAKEQVLVNDVLYYKQQDHMSAVPDIATLPTGNVPSLKWQNRQSGIYYIPL